MPELPEVESLRRMLLSHLLGARVTSLTVHLPRIVRGGDLGWLKGRTITSISRVGKSLTFHTDRKVRLFVRLGMTGTLLWEEGAGSGGNDHIRAEIGFRNGRVLFRDIRTLGGLWVRRDGREPWKPVGPDALSADFTSRCLRAAFSGRAVAVKVALLDQSIVSGVGNIYASESLYASRIHPARPAGSLSVQEVRRLVRAIKRILRAAISSGGTTFRDFQLSDGREGGFRRFLKVYGKAGEPCPNCWNRIERVVIGGRAAFYCPRCQPFRGERD